MKKPIYEIPGTIAYELCRPENMKKFNECLDLNSAKTWFTEVIHSDKITDKSEVLVAEDMMRNAKNLSHFLSSVATFMTGTKSEPKKR